MATTMRLLVGITAAAVIGLFALKNSPAVHLDLLFAEATLPLFAALGAAFLVGVLVSLMAVTARGYSRRRREAARSRESLRAASSLADQL